MAEAWIADELRHLEENSIDTAPHPENYRYALTEYERCSKSFRLALKEQPYPIGGLFRHAIDESGSTNGDFVTMFSSFDFTFSPLTSLESSCRFLGQNMCLAIHCIRLAPIPSRMRFIFQTRYLQRWTVFLTSMLLATARASSAILAAIRAALRRVKQRWIVRGPSNADRRADKRSFVFRLNIDFSPTASHPCLRRVLRS